MRAEHEGYFTAMMQVVFDDVPDNPLARQSVISIMGTGAFDILHDEAMFVHMYYL
jgi:hypothetical protein